ncbi:MAG TPA: hypothetical protein VGU66_10770 [Candidatus Elarobacter sp.]|nr:hypothetical protein [Candidatus Elarobacter sp.]
MRMSGLRTALVLAAFGLAGCGGGGSSSLPSAAQSAPDKSTSAATVAVTITIPSAGKTSAKVRGPHYVSFGTQGMTVVSKQGATQLGSTTFGTTVASNPSGCHAVSGGTSCTFALAASAPSTDFFITSYDAAPVSGAIPNTAHALATFQQLAMPIVPRQVNNLAFTMGGIVASLTLGNDAVTSAPAQGTQVKKTVSLIPKDASGEIILTAAGDTTLDRPIGVTLSESNGTGHSYLSTDNGATHATLPVSVADGSTTVTLVYDGGGAAPDPAAPANAYKSTITASIASSNDNTTGTSLNNAATKSFDLAPVFLVASHLDATDHNGAGFAAGSPPTFTFTNIAPSSGLTQGMLDIVAAEAATTSTYASGLTSGSCAGVTFSQTGTAPAAGSPVSLAFTPVLGSNPTTSPCAFAATDGAGSSVAVTTVYSATGGSGTVVIPGNGSSSLIADGDFSNPTLSANTTTTCTTSFGSWTSCMDGPAFYNGNGGQNLPVPPNGQGAYLANPGQNGTQASFRQNVTSGSTVTVTLGYKGAAVPGVANSGFFGINLSGSCTSPDFVPNTTFISDYGPNTSWKAFSHSVTISGPCEILINGIGELSSFTLQ